MLNCIKALLLRDKRQHSSLLSLQNNILFKEHISTSVVLSSSALDVLHIFLLCHNSYHFYVFSCSVVLAFVIKRSIWHKSHSKI